MINLKIMIMFAFLIFTGCQNDAGTKNGNNSYSELSETTELKKAPDFQLTSTDGRQISLNDYKGKIVILDFWATWCGPCRRGVPDLVEIQKEYNNDVVVLGISTDKFTGTDNEVNSFMQEFNINYPVVFADQNIIDSYGGIQAIPTSFLIDQEGNIIDMHVGLVPKSVYTEKIDKLM